MFNKDSSKHDFVVDDLNIKSKNPILNIYLMIMLNIPRDSHIDIFHRASDFPLLVPF
jgi:hypothetical protein